MSSITRFKIARMQAGLRQLDLAKALQVSENQITKWETGRGIPPEELLEPLAIVLHISPSEITDIFKEMMAQ